MMRGLVLSCMVLVGGTAAAQDFGVIEEEALPPLILDRGDLRPFEETREERELRFRVATAPGAVLRGLDKVSGDVTDLTLGPGETARLGRIEVTLDECRYPEANPAGDAFAHLTVRSDGVDGPVFDGWMIASSPALSALDHPRYDVWVMRCVTS